MDQDVPRCSSVRQSDHPLDHLTRTDGFKSIKLSEVAAVVGAAGAGVIAITMYTNIAACLCHSWRMT